MSIFHHFINGEWIAPDKTRLNINPSNPDEVIGEYAEANAKDMESAVLAAADAAKTWSRSTPQQRFDVLDFIGSEILARKQELGLLLAREEGKVLPEAVGEVTRAGFIFKFFAGEALRIGGQAIASVRPNMEVITSREAVGGGTDHTMEFPDCDTCLENCTCSRVWQCGSPQTLRTNAWVRMGSGRYYLAFWFAERRL